MGYSKEVVEAVREEFEVRRARAEGFQAAALNKVYAAVPQIATIDAKLRNVLPEITAAIALGPEKCAAQIEIIRNNNLALQKKREELLIEAGFDKDYTDIKYACPLCKDTGYTDDGVICACFKTALTLEGYKRSGIANLIEKQSFESFSLDFYTGEEREIMEDNLSELRSFAQNFASDRRSFLLCGDTGLGKTHLSTAVAKCVIESGYDVIYETAQNVFFDFDNDRFRDRFGGEEPVSGKYLECDLLILDDLGTETVSQFSLSCLYNIINTRLNRGLPMIISTNLSSTDIRRIYQDRITSRLFGEFTIKQFVGRDIRRQKIKNNSKKF